MDDKALRQIGKAEFYGLIKEYEKIDSMFVPPLLKNYMVGFFQWLLSQREAQDFLIEANLKSEKGLEDAPPEYIEKHLRLVEYLKWKNELIEVTAKETGEDVSTIKINDTEARQWFDDGFTPYQTFRETYSTENDGE